jgi:hypothetical protein
MKIRTIFRWVLGLLSLALVLTLPELAPNITGLGGGLIIADGFLARISDDPQLWNKWDKVAQKQGELKTEFSESEIGVTWGDDGPEPSDRVAASPIVLKQDLAEGGKFMQVPIYNPLFKGPSSILNAGRYGDQTRIGAEEQLSRHNFTVLLDKWHLGISEKEIEESIPNTANMTEAKFMQRMVESWTDNAAQRMDYGVYFAAFAGADIHHYIAAGLRGELSNGDVPVGDPQMGLNSAPFEHRRSYAYIDDGGSNKLVPIAYNANPDTYEANITAEISKIKASTDIGLDFFRRVSRICKRSAMIPCRMRDSNGTMSDYYLVMVPGGAKDLAENDAQFERVMNSAFQSSKYDHTLLKAGDVLYKNLCIRDSSKLEEEDEDLGYPYFSARSSFNAISTALTDTSLMTFNRATVNGIEKLSITPGVRQFTAASNAAVDFGQANTHAVGRVLVMGAATVARCTGKNFKLEKLEVTQYGLKDGIGKTKLFGQLRNEKWTVGGVYDSTPQSFQIFVKMDDNIIS